MYIKRFFGWPWAVPGRFKRETLSRMTGGLLYSLFGKARRPIEIQRRLGARDVQNKARMSAPVARTLAAFVSVGVPLGCAVGGAAAESASCLLIEGHRA